MVQSVASHRIDLRCQWMFGKTFDIAFFYAPILLGIAMYMLGKSTLAQVSPFWTIAAANALGAGPFHQGATLFTYMDKENRKYYQASKSRQIIYFAAPIIILLATIAGAVYVLPATIMIWLIWSIQHLVQQNAGILLLYHRHGQGQAIVPRPLEMRCQQAAAVAFTLIFFYRDMMHYHLSVVMLPLIAASAIYTLKLVVQYVICLDQQVKAGAYINTAAQLFFCTSMICLAPLAFLGHTFAEGYMIPITVHWFQYIAINYMLVQNKYNVAERASNLPFAKLSFAHPMTLFFLLCLTIVAFTFAISAAKTMSIYTQPLTQAILAGTILGLGNVHYFLDAFLWKFREPYQRQAILPYLLAGR